MQLKNLNEQLRQFLLTKATVTGLSRDSIEEGTTLASIGITSLEQLAGPDFTNTFGFELNPRHAAAPQNGTYGALANFIKSSIRMLPVANRVVMFVASVTRRNFSDLSVDSRLCDITDDAESFADKVAKMLVSEFGQKDKYTEIVALVRDRSEFRTIQSIADLVQLLPP